jgi:hypothetical protein
MRLTWRDLATTLFMGAVIALYVAHLRGAEGWLFSSTRGATTGVLVLGAVGGCALSRAGDLYVAGQSGLKLAVTMFSTALGVTALVAGVVALIAASGGALAVLFGATMALWLVSTVRHALAGPAAPSPLDPRTHEVIDQPHVHH